MSSTQFKADQRDLEFVLFEQVRIQDFEHEAYKEFDEDLYRMVLSEAVKLGEETLAPINATGDRTGCKWSTDGVVTPTGYGNAYRTYTQAGWTGTALPQSEGGQGLPVPLALASVEIFTSACPAFVMYPGLTVAATRVIQRFGTPWMQEILVPKMLSGEWAGTMCLTEPQAGTALGDLRTTSEQDGENYRLRGTKIFVSGGEQDLTDNIIHLVLAQCPTGQPGIKGLGLFVVPKMKFDAQGTITGPNDISCAGIEHKMGINGSATCLLSFGDTDGAEGWIIGGEGEGIIHMFTMMNDARIGVGVQGYSIAAAAYGYALAYAKDRIQGTRLKDLKDFDAERVAIVEHPDVRRMLIKMRAQVEGMRSLGLTLGMYGNHYHADPEGPRAEEYKALLEVLTPICKAWSTDQGFEVCTDALQVLGGYGYTQEYPVEQCLRDSKIGSIYEGTNGIQALDLIGRKMASKGGMNFMTVMGWLNTKIAAISEAGGFDDEVRAVEAARDRLGEAAMHLGGIGMQGEHNLPALHAVDMLRLFGDVAIATLSGEQALIAQGRLRELASTAGVDLSDAEASRAWFASDSEAGFYSRKCDNFRFFAHQFLPRTAAALAAIKSSDRSALDSVF